MIKKIEIKINGKWKLVKTIQDIQDCEAVKISETITEKHFKKYFPEQYKKDRVEDNSGADNKEGAIIQHVEVINKLNIN